MKKKINFDKYWKKLEKIEGEFYGKTYELEKQMAKETGVEDICFFWVDNEIVGIGDDNRCMKLVHRR